MDNYIGRYKKRIIRNGNNVGESYHSNTVNFIDAHFHESPTYRVMDVISSKNPETTRMDARVVGIDRLGTLREIVLRPSHDLSIGSYVEFDEETWLVFDKHGGNGATNVKLTVIKCNQDIKWKNINNDINSYPCVASATDLGSKSRQSKNEIEWNKYDVRLPVGHLYISLELNDTTREISLNQRFIFGSKVYQVIGIDDMTTVDKDGHGVVQLTVKITTEVNGDNFEDGIAYNDSVDLNSSNDGGAW